MTGISTVMERVNEIQQKIQQFQPAKVKEFQEYYSQMLSKESTDVDSSPTDHPIGDEPVDSVTQNQSDNISNKNRRDNDFSNLIKDASQKYAVPEGLIKAVIKQESNFDSNAISHAGAKGLMQLMPNTAKEMGVQNIFDPKQNIFGGTKYLKGLLSQFKGNIPLSLAAYNAGISRVLKASGIPNIRETKNYVNKVIQSYQKIKNLK